MDNIEAKTDSAPELGIVPGSAWFINHPGTMQRTPCDSFEQAMDKWFEGFNLPWLEINGKAEHFDVSYARVKAHLRPSPLSQNKTSEQRDERAGNSKKD